jgi:hypothetical protein
MFRHDALHSGRAGQNSPHLFQSPSSITAAFLAHAPGSTQAILQITNTGAGNFIWNATAPSGVTLAPTTGIVTTTTYSTATISTGSRPPGVYHLGNIVITATLNGNPVSGSPVAVPVTLNVLSELYKFFSPLIVK